MATAGVPVVSLGAKLFHHALNEFLGLAQFAVDDLNVERRLVGQARGVAINGVLADEDHGVREAVQRDGQAPAMAAHHSLVVIEFFLVIVKG